MEKFFFQYQIHGKIFSVDWSSAAGNSYASAQKNVNAVGQSVAQFIDWLHLDKGALHVVGFDLGGLKAH